MKCDICGGDFTPKNPRSYSSHIGFKSKKFCSDKCWRQLIEIARIDTKILIQKYEQRKNY